MICGTCCVTLPVVDRVITHYRFTEPLRTLIHAFKYDSALYLSSWLTQLLLDAKPEGYTSECLIPVPLHPTKLHQRGFNQAALLTKALSNHLNLPHGLDRCKKVVITAPQAGLSATHRQTNLNHSFRAKRLPYQHVTLIDDVYTTGATANTIATLLKKQGVIRVDVWCCARACL
jgi:ComF family protein